MHRFNVVSATGESEHNLAQAEKTVGSEVGAASRKRCDGIDEMHGRAEMPAHLV